MRSTIEPGLMARCPRCGGSVPADAKRCRRCGMGLGDQVLLLGPGVGSDDGPETPMAAPVPRRRRPRWVDLTGLAAVIALLFGVNALASPGGEEQEAAEPGSTTTSILERPATTTTERPARSTTSTTTLERLLGPLLPETTGTVLVTETAEGLVAIDVDTGQVEGLDVPGVEAGGWVPALSVGDQVVIVRGGQSYAVRPFGGQPAVALGPAEQVLPGSDAERVWLQTSFNGDGNAASVRAVTLDGVETVLEFVLPSGVWPLAAVPGGLLVDAAGTLMVFDPFGSDVRRVADGQYVGVAGATLLTVACDEDLACGLHLIDLDTGEDRAVAPPAFGWGFVPWATSVAASDGRWALVSVQQGPSRGAALLDVESGSATMVDATFNDLPPVLSGDGRWVFQLRGEVLWAAGVDAELTSIDALDLSLRNVLVALPRTA